jgi:Zn-dependent protease with chaperone function
MKFVPKQLHDNVNIPAVSPMQEFFRVAAKLLVVILGIYIVLGICSDFIAPRISIKTEVQLGRLFRSKFEHRKPDASEKRLQAILDKLVSSGPDLPAFTYTVYTDHSKYPNAFAYPGGTIVMTDAMLELAPTENQLAMVLAHELGHYNYRDHLSGLGRDLVFLVMSSVFFGPDSPATRFIANAVTNTEMRFSQRQEQRADLFGLDLLTRTYGHAGGSTEILEALSRKHPPIRILYFFSTHPYPPSRVAAVKERIRQKNYPIAPEIPWNIQETLSRSR